MNIRRIPINKNYIMDNVNSFNNIHHDRKLINKKIISKINKLEKERKLKKDRFSICEHNFNYKILTIKSDKHKKCYIKFNLPSVKNEPILYYRLKNAFNEQLSIINELHNFSGELLANRFFTEDKKFNEKEYDKWLSQKSNHFSKQAHLYYNKFCNLKLQLTNKSNKKKNNNQHNLQKYLQYSLENRIIDMINRNAIRILYYYNTDNNIYIYELIDYNVISLSHLYAIIILYNQYLYLTKKKYI